MFCYDLASVMKERRKPSGSAFLAFLNRFSERRRNQCETGRSSSRRFRRSVRRRPDHWSDRTSTELYFGNTKGRNAGCCNFLQAPRRPRHLRRDTANPPRAEQPHANRPHILAAVGLASIVSVIPNMVFAARGPAAFALVASGGTAFANNGLSYGVGTAIRPIVSLYRFHVAGFIAIHQGDKRSIRWDTTLATNGGRQDYSSTPIVAEAEFGYHFPLAIRAREMVLIPFATAGATVISLRSSGVYGSSSITHTGVLVGLGLSYFIDVTTKFFVGVTARLQLASATADFEFGAGDPNAYHHGFKTSIWYGATFAELGWHF